MIHLVTHAVLFAAFAALGACVAEGCPAGYRANGGRCLVLAEEAGSDIDAGSVDGGACGACPTAFPICVEMSLRCVECVRDTDCTAPMRPSCNALQQCTAR